MYSDRLVVEEIEKRVGFGNTDTAKGGSGVLIKANRESAEQFTNLNDGWTAVLQELKNIKAEATEEVERIVKHRLETDQRNSNSYGGISSIMASEQKLLPARNTAVGAGPELSGGSDRKFHRWKENDEDTTLARFPVTGTPIEKFPAVNYEGMTVEKGRDKISRQSIVKPSSEFDHVTPGVDEDEDNQMFAVYEDIKALRAEAENEMRLIISHWQESDRGSIPTVIQDAPADNRKVPGSNTVPGSMTAVDSDDLRPSIVKAADTARSHRARPFRRSSTVQPRIDDGDRVMFRATKVTNMLTDTGELTERTSVEMKGPLKSFEKDCIKDNRKKNEERQVDLTESTRSSQESWQRAVKSQHEPNMSCETKKTPRDRKVMKTIDKVNAVGAAKSMEERIDDDSGGLLLSIMQLERRLTRKKEEILRIQKEHAAALACVGKRYSEDHRRLQRERTDLRMQIESMTARNQAAVARTNETIASLEKTLHHRNDKICELQTAVKDKEKLIEDIKQTEEKEKKSNVNEKLIAAIHQYERNATDHKNKLSERDAMISHLKQRLDESLNRGRSKFQAALERSRKETAVKDTKISELEKEIQNLQDQLSRLSRMAARGSASTSRSRQNVHSAGPSAKGPCRDSSMRSSRSIPFLPLISSGRDTLENPLRSRRTAVSEVRCQTGRSTARRM